MQVLLEFHSWFGESFVIVLECKEFANVQSSGIAMDKDRTL
jgi:hypothetical protein